jgi:predicted small integral membrane protein
VGNWLFNLPVLWMAIVVFGATYVITGLIYLLVTELAVNERARAFTAVSPGMLSLEGRRQRIVISESALGTVKWVGILLQGLCTLVAIAMVHSNNRLTCAIALTLFSTGIALSMLLIAAYSRPFTSVGPELLKQVIPREQSG